MTAYKNRITITVPKLASRHFKKGRVAYVVNKGQWYALVPYKNTEHLKLRKRMSALQAELKALRAKQKALDTGTQLEAQFDLPAKDVNVND